MVRAQDAGVDTFRLARWQQVLGVVLVLGFVATVAYAVWAGTRPSTYEAPWGIGSRHLDRGGTEMTLTYTGGACDDFADADAEEDAETVRILVTVTEQGNACTDQALRGQTFLRLVEPLGHRTLIDASTGKEVVPTDGSRCGDTYVLLTQGEGLVAQLSPATHRAIHVAPDVPAQLVVDGACADDADIHSSNDRVAKASDARVMDVSGQWLTTDLDLGHPGTVDLSVGFSSCAPDLADCEGVLVPAGVTRLVVDQPGR
jgi:hypothetical protein